VRLLLDTHALLWALEGNPKLSTRARDAIQDLDNEILVSAVSAWEIAIKKALGRLKAPSGLSEAIDDAGFVRRLINFRDAVELESLPSVHGDPFDRMLVAQARVEGIPIVTKDPHIALYSVQTLW